MHRSALQEKEIKVTAGGADEAPTASADEIAAAAKGFNEEVEESYRADNAELDFTWVDTMESWTVSAVEAEEFFAQGAVRPAAGGAQ